MFKDKYKRVQDAVCMTDADKEKTLSGMQKRRKKMWLVPVTVAACVCLIAGGILTVLLKSADVPSPAKKTAVASVESYSEVYEKISELKKATDYTGGMYFNGIAEKNDAAVIEDEVAEPVPEAPISQTDSDKDYSETNVQVAGVDEPDIIKTDGEYIYIMKEGGDEGVDVFKADGKNTKFVTTINFVESSEDVWYSANGMYLHGDVLIIIAYKGKTYDSYMGGGLFDSMCGWYPYQSEGETHIYTYDVKDPKNPMLISDVTQDGYYAESRLTDGMIYTVTSYGVNLNDKIKEKKPETYIPSVCDKEGEKLVEPKCITILDNVNDANYIVASSIDLNSPDTVKSQIAVLGSVDSLFASSSNMLLYRTAYDSKEYKAAVSETGEIVPLSDDADTNVYAEEREYNTYLYLISMNDGKLSFEKSQTITGIIDDQFSIDEYNGYFRIVANIDTSVYLMEKQNGIYGSSVTYSGSWFQNETYNNLYILDEQLKTVGKIEKIAEDEYIKSARFMGDIGYFVTFRQTDPLFSVDLSDPKNPKITGKLKIPGFSEYLQSYGDGLLLGIGFDADTESGGTTGIKLSMFDVSKPKDVKEVAKFTLKDRWANSVFNHKAILADPDKNLIGFLCDMEYIVFSYENGAFTEKASIKIPDDEWSAEVRGLYIGSYYYVVNMSLSKITVLDMNSFETVATVEAK